MKDWKAVVLLNVASNAIWFLLLLVVMKIPWARDWVLQMLFTTVVGTGAFYLGKKIQKSQVLQEFPCEPIAMQASQRNEELLRLKSSAILVTPKMGAGAVSFSPKKNKIVVECFLISFTPISTKFTVVSQRLRRWVV